MTTSERSEPAMQDGQCPKCGSEEVYVQPHGLRTGVGEQYAYEVTLRTSGQAGGIELAATACTSCGYVELYVLYQHHLPLIAQQWRKLPL